jgi:hypothetical protein
MRVWRRMRDGRRGGRAKKCLEGEEKRLEEGIKKRHSRWQNQVIVAQGMLKAVMDGRMLVEGKERGRACCEVGRKIWPGGVE